MAILNLARPERSFERLPHAVDMNLAEVQPVALLLVERREAEAVLRDAGERGGHGAMAASAGIVSRAPVAGLHPQRAHALNSVRGATIAPQCSHRSDGSWFMGCHRLLTMVTWNSALPIRTTSPLLLVMTPTAANVTMLRRGAVVLGVFVDGLGEEGLEVALGHVGELVVGFVGAIGLGVDVGVAGLPDAGGRVATATGASVELSAGIDDHTAVFAAKGWFVVHGSSGVGSGCHRRGCRAVGDGWEGTGMAGW